jgi:predicted branched-subunit amino acid permease
MTVVLDIDATTGPPISQVPSGRGAFTEGARDIVPMVLGVIPFALAIGAMIGTSSISTAQGLFSGPGILAGAAQLSTIEMIESGAAPVIIVVSALMINARILLYSTALAPWFREERLARRLMLAIPVIDQLHFTCTPRFERGDLDARGRRCYYAGAAGLLVGAWTLTQAVAIVGGARLPEWVGLQIAAPLALAGLMAKSISGRAAITAAVVAGGVVVLGAGLPLHSAVLVAAVAGMVAGTVTAGRADAALRSRRSDTNEGASR